jgi:Tol biopolymer transport system component
MKNSIPLLVISLMLLSQNSYTQTQKKGSPLDDLPPYITRLTHFGQRADWSHDGKRILFLEKTFGDVYELEIATGLIRPMTHHYFHEGYTRALYLSNGDILLSGARNFDASDPWPSRNEKNAELWVLKRDLSGPPDPLGEHCSEGPAVSRKHMKIAWTQGGAIYTGEIAFVDGAYLLENKKEILTEKNLPFECHLETQNFRPPLEEEITFSAYDYRGGEVMGVNIKTGEVTNYSDQDNQYDEPEGIFPDGQYTLVESDRHASRGKKFMGIQNIDIHKLALDGSGRYERITYFNDYEGYKASNPVVSDDGKFIAFQMAKLGDPAGVGRGLFILDLKEFEKSKGR